MFTNFYSNSSYTGASVASMITSTYPFDYGEYLEYSTPAKLSRKRILLSEILKDYGYSTAFFHDNPYLSPIFGYDRGFDRVVDFGDRGQAASKVKRGMFSFFRTKEVRRLVWRTKNLIAFLRWYFKDIPLNADAETVLKEATEWVNRVTQPFFLWVHLMDTHTPYCPKQNILNRFGIHKFHAFKVVYKRFRRKKLSNKEFEIFKLLYDVQIYQIDCALSKYLPKITKGQVENNYVIITADHGENLEDKDKAGSHSGRLTDELLRIPLIIYGGELKARRVTTRASLIDLSPTILDFLRIETPKNFRGRSLLRIRKSRKVIAQGIFKEADVNAKFEQ
jgi:arylsulfatase A-like enzyme